MTVADAMAFDSPVTPSDAQTAAINEIVRWYTTPGSPQVFYLAGYAGTGKSTIYSFARQELERHGARKVVTCAYTGKAASVLRRKGVGDAMTIHAAIYSPQEDEETGEVKFKLNPLGPAALADLIGLDECSMVDDDMAEDLLSFGRKILVMGDPGQLPPIRGLGAFTSRLPDVFLTEVHRQAAESPIIRLATLARQGEELPIGNYGGGVEVLRLTGQTAELAYRESTQTICGVHKARHALTRQIRERRGFGVGEIPVEGERLICCRNDRTHGIFNGGLGWARKVKHCMSGMLKLDVEMDDLERPLKELLVHPYLFWEHTRGKQDRPRGIRGMQDFDFGYVLTAHKAQGSEWPHVTVVDDSATFKEDRHRWRYTAITRASEGLAFLRRQ